MAGNVHLDVRLGDLVKLQIRMCGRPGGAHAPPASGRDIRPPYQLLIVNSAGTLSDATRRPFGRSLVSTLATTSSGDRP